MADTPVSIREVAALAGVSLGTVSNVLNRPQVVDEPTRTRVQAAIRELGFIRTESARHLRAGRSHTIGLVVLDIANPFLEERRVQGLLITPLVVRASSQGRAQGQPRPRGRARSRASATPVADQAAG